MKKELFTDFNTRQYMAAKDIEIFYYNDINLDHVRAHQHEYYEIYFFLEGDVTYEVGNKSYDLQYGDYLLIPPGTPHHPIFRFTRTDPHTNRRYRRFVLWLEKDFYHNLLRISGDFSYTFDYVEANKSYLFRTDFVTSQEIQGQLLSLIEESNGNKAFHQLNAHLMAASFLLHLNRITYDLLHQLPSAYGNVLYLNICDYINNHLDEDLSLDHLARFFYASKFHISHIFKDNMGISLHQYIIKKRLQASKNGILSGIPLNRLYQQYGFSDYTSFYRAFKKEFGLSPKEYRDQKPLPEGYYP